MSKRFWIENNEILDSGFFLSDKQNYVDVMNNLEDIACKWQHKCADLEAKLAEAQKTIDGLHSRWVLEKETSKNIAELREKEREEWKAKLAESEEKCEELKQEISKCTGELPPNVAFDIANDDIRYQIVCNLTDRNQEHRKTIRELKQQLSDKHKELHYKTAECEKWKTDYENCSKLEKIMTKEHQYCLDNWRASEQDKISFCIEKLKSIRNELSNLITLRTNETFLIDGKKLRDYINNEIELTKKENKNV